MSEKRMNLYELREILNKLPDTFLKKSGIAGAAYCEDGTDGHMHLVTSFSEQYEDSDEWDKINDETPENKLYEELTNRFVRPMNDDIERESKGRNPEGEETYFDTDLEPDWE